MNDRLDQRPIAVVRTRLPYIDRRSLSQAWFSALHLAAETRPHAIPARRSSDAARGPSGAPPAGPFASARPNERARAPRTVAPFRPRAVTSDASAAKRPCDAPAVTKRTAAFERARSYPPFRTSLTVGVGAGGARIKLLLRRDGPTLHVIALCTPGNVDLVRRALACADAHLRRSGESVCASVQMLAEPSV